MDKTRPYKRKPASNPPGRPKTLGGDTRIVTLHLDSDVCDAIDRAVGSSAEFKSRADFIRNAISEALRSSTSTTKVPAHLGNVRPNAGKSTRRWVSKGGFEVLPLTDKYDVIPMSDADRERLESYLPDSVKIVMADAAKAMAKSETFAVARVRARKAGKHLSLFGGTPKGAALKSQK